MCMGFNVWCFGYDISPFGLDVFNIKIGNDTNVMTVDAHLPSIGTILGFLIVGVIGIRKLYNVTSQKLRMVVGGVGMVALIGYVTGQPSLFYYIPHHSTAIALHTAIGFILLSKALSHGEKH